MTDPNDRRDDAAAGGEDRPSPQADALRAEQRDTRRDEPASYQTSPEADRPEDAEARASGTASRASAASGSSIQEQHIAESERALKVSEGVRRTRTPDNVDDREEPRGRS